MIIENEFLSNIKAVYGDNAVVLVQKAFDFALSKHKGQVRDSGEEYINHPFNVAKILLTMKADLPTIISGLLHDVMEESDVSFKEIQSSFGNEVALICEGFSKIEKIKLARHLHSEENENLRKMLLCINGDSRIAFVKLADRLHNMQTLDVKSREDQIKIASETMDLYVPVAERLGINQLKHTLEDLSFKYMFPNDYNFCKDYLDSKYKQSKDIVEIIKNKIINSAKNLGVEVLIQGRVKGIFSFYRKTKEKGIENIYDVIATRIIVKEIKDCYTMLGAVHDLWKPIDGRIKDYIAHPKKNFYRSLHTTVLYPTANGDVPFEIQIRTEDMHVYCEYGMAAHWMYKEHGSVSTNQQGNSALYEIKTQKSKNSELLTTNSESEEFLDIIKTGFYSGKIFVFTPNLNVVELEKGSIPLDFAYAIHSNLGNKCVGAKVNGKMVPITTELKTCDTVEVQTSQLKTPSRDWLKIVKCKSTAQKIRSYFKKERREENEKIGKEMLEEYAKRNGFSLSRLLEDKDCLLEVQSKYSFLKPEDMFASVGYGGFTPAQVLSKFISKLKQKSKEKTQKNNQSSTKKANDGVLAGGESNLLKKFAKCCNPIPGDDIVGYVSRGKGVTIHRADCNHIKSLEEDRFIKTEWDKSSLKELYDASFKVIAKNTTGVFTTISNKIAENKIDITYMLMDKNAKTDQVLLSIGVKISSRKDLSEIIAKISAMNEVYDVYR